jgi:hypothetical protein
LQVLINLFMKRRVKMPTDVSHDDLKELLV